MSRVAYRCSGAGLHPPPCTLAQAHAWPDPLPNAPSARGPDLHPECPVRTPLLVRLRGRSWSKAPPRRRAPWTSGLLPPPPHGSLRDQTLQNRTFLLLSERCQARPGQGAVGGGPGSQRPAPASPRKAPRHGGGRAAAAARGAAPGAQGSRSSPRGGTSRASEGGLAASSRLLKTQINYCYKRTGRARGRRALSSRRAPSGCSGESGAP